ncbi:hypothetical protein DEJ36_16860 [Curtobacterium sp. MCPF17_052]|nr:hypothetical protein [Curtobacterium sp. MCPF17_052]WIB12351.1 hypothetical protein DEJ36_16860 [Curtobacterium sp. MCPF17_052]
MVAREQQAVPLVDEADVATGVARGPQHTEVPAWDRQSLAVMEQQVGERRLDGPLPELPTGAPHRQDTVQPVVGDSPGPGVPLVPLGIGTGVLEGTDLGRVHRDRGS